MNSSLYNYDGCDRVDTEEQQIQVFAKQMLHSRFFIGNYQEKRYVASLKSYRDVISLSNDESELIRDLMVVKQRICGFHSEDHWIGITDPDTIGAPAGYSLWTELPDEIFGSYWYKISKVKFRPNETLLKLKVIRQVTTSTGDSLSKTLFAANKSDVNTPKDSSAKEQLKWFFNTIATIKNVKESATFLSVLFVALVTGLIPLLQYLGDFTLKVMREVSHLIQVLTPSVIAFINLIAKIIGGFYLLILSMWKTRSPTVYRSPYVPLDSPMLTSGDSSYNTVYFRRGLPPPDYKQHSRSVRITRLD